MSKISNYINDINKNAFSRHLEVSYMFSKLNEYTNPLEKYFFSRTVVVFTYATLEKFIKLLSEIALRAALENSYFNENYILELMQLLKCNSDPKNYFDLLMHHKNIYISNNPLDYRNDPGYFSRNGRIDSVAIAHIINILNLNRKSPNLKIPKIAIDSLAFNRMSLAHGDYIDELSRFGPSRSNLTITEINEYINDKFKLGDKTRDEILTFIDEFKNKIILFLEEIKMYENTRTL